MAKRAYKVVKGSILVPSSGYHIEAEGKLWDVFYDTGLRLWTGFAVDAQGNQICAAQYDVDKKTLCAWLVQMGWEHGMFPMYRFDPRFDPAA